MSQGEILSSRLNNRLNTIEDSFKEFSDSVRLTLGEMTVQIQKKESPPKEKKPPMQEKTKRLHEQELNKTLGEITNHFGTLDSYRNDSWACRRTTKV